MRARTRRARLSADDGARGALGVPNYGQVRCGKDRKVIDMPGRSGIPLDVGLEAAAAVSGIRDFHFRGF